MTYSCTNMSLAPDVVNREDAQKEQYVVIGVIEDINEVTIEGDREAGAIAGGLIGGAAGNGAAPCSARCRHPQHLDQHLREGSAA